MRKRKLLTFFIFSGMIISGFIPVFENSYATATVKNLAKFTLRKADLKIVYVIFLFAFIIIDSIRRNKKNDKKNDK